MKFLTVFQFEFGNYIKNKTYIITTFFSRNCSGRNFISAAIL